jgi:hypothetical protein
MLVVTSHGGRAVYGRLGLTLAAHARQLAPVGTILPLVLPVSSAFSQARGQLRRSQVWGVRGVTPPGAGRAL